MNKNSVQNRSKNITLKRYLFFASFAQKKRKIMNRSLFEWFGYYFNDHGGKFSSFKTVTAQILIKLGNQITQT